MDLFSNFFHELVKSNPSKDGEDIPIENKRKIISSLNDFLYTNYENIGTTRILDGDFEYFSDFHKFWEKHHEEILNPVIDEKQCFKIAEILHNIFVNHGEKTFTELYNTFALQPKEICLIRYFSANQDFRGSRQFEKLFKIYSNDPSKFNVNNINSNPEDFLKNLKITDLSQSDKRLKYAKTASQLLIDNKIEPYGLLNYCGNDFLKVRTLLTKNRGSGFGKKKTDMFLRDMCLLGVWLNGKNFDKIDVASDINTIKVALRTGILQTEIPLLSSFLDIFCYQYTLMDEKSAMAWRRVWEIWKENYPKECIESPCLIDYLVYRVIGKEFCKETLVTFEGETCKHTFKWHSARNKTCQICNKKSIKEKAISLTKTLPCTDDDGYISIRQSKYVSGMDAVLPGIDECPFVEACNPRDSKFIKFNPPKSISILGQTGWERARTRKGEGGGGLMA